MTMDWAALTIVLVVGFMASLFLRVFLNSNVQPTDRFSVSKRLMMGLLISVFFMFTLTTALQAVALAVISLVLPLKTKPRTRLKIGLGVTAASFAIMLVPGALELIRRHEARQQYPIESLADRLEYESVTLNDPTAAFTSANQDKRTVALPINKRLAKAREDNERYSYRARELKRIHRQEEDAFVLTSGLGIGRLFVQLPRIDFTQLPVEDTKALPVSDDASFVAMDGATMRKNMPFNSEIVSPQAVSLPDALLGLHDKGRRNFLNPDLLGYVAEKQRAAGFISHRFNIPRWPLPADDQFPTWMIALQSLPSEHYHMTWSIVRFELVSLLKHKEPRVYVSKELPRLDKLKNVPTRALDEFEEEALAKLWHNEDIVIANESNSIRMLGSLRAQEHCLDCHAVQHGQLLGAFSYELRLRQVMPQPR
jgi:multisubunit Na+/H+ antiporter MnhE subunit